MRSICRISLIEFSIIRDFSSTLHFASSPAFSEELESCEDELRKLYTLYFLHTRCLDALHIQGSYIEKNTLARESTKYAASTDAQSMILLPYGLADSSDELSDVDDNDDMPKKVRDAAETKDDIQMKGNDMKINTKLRISTGGRPFGVH